MLKHHILNGSFTDTSGSILGLWRDNTKDSSCPIVQNNIDVYPWNRVIDTNVISVSQNSHSEKTSAVGEKSKIIISWRCLQLNKVWRKQRLRYALCLISTNLLRGDSDSRVWVIRRLDSPIHLTMQWNLWQRVMVPLVYIHGLNHLQ